MVDRYSWEGISSGSSATSGMSNHGQTQFGVDHVSMGMLSIMNSQAGDGRWWSACGNHDALVDDMLLGHYGDFLAKALL